VSWQNVSQTIAGEAKSYNEWTHLDESQFVSQVRAKDGAVIAIVKDIGVT
jgi:hypothetical protein